MSARTVLRSAATVLIAATALTTVVLPANATNNWPHTHCDPSGPTQQDAAIAAAVSPRLNRQMAGVIDAYNISCARVLTQAVKDRGLSARAAEIAMATAIVESTLENVNVEVDHDSLGLFQQRASWGSREQRTNPVWSTNKFLDAMEQFYPNGSWATAPIGEVAADVQRPAAQYRYRYAVQADDAVKIVDALGIFGSLPSSVQASRVVYQPNTGVTEVFARSANNKLVHTYNSGVGAWVPWSEMGNADIAGDPVSIYRAGTATTEVFVRGVDGRVLHTYNSGGGWMPLTAMGDWTVKGDLSVVYQQHSGQIEVFARGGDDKLIHNYSQGNLWSGWSVLAGEWTIASNPVAIYRPNTQVTEVFARGTNGALNHISFNGNWSGWSSIGNQTITGDPAVVYQTHNGITEVFARNTSGQLVHTYNSGVGPWMDWTVIGGGWTFKGNPTVVYQPNNRVTEVFVRGDRDDKLNHTYVINGQWYPWSSIGDWTIGGDPMPIYRPNTNVVEVIARGSDGKAIHTYHKDTWMGWFELGGQPLAEES